ncbi:hypothetical protein ID866_3644 [Astraeus odoratus]|nr:hypothetical protein ID866_3644 [Astraeus odoratus]
MTSPPVMPIVQSLALLAFTKRQALFTRSVLCRLYSEWAPPRRRNWRLEGHVPPPTLVQEDTPAFDLREDEPPPRRRTRPDTAETPEQWQRHRERIKEKFPDGWNPKHKLSREAMEALRSLHALDKATFTTSILASKFKISPEAVRRILRSKWEPSKEKRARLAERERRDREERVVRSRIEEKMKKIQILLETRKNLHSGDSAPAEGQTVLGRRSSDFEDELFFR